MLNKKKYITLIALVLAFSMFGTSCASSQQKFQSAWGHLQENLDEAMGNTSETTSETSIVETEETVSSEDIEDEEEDIDEDIDEELEEDTEETLAPTAAPTNTPTPTEVPVVVPERVDFSELTEDTLSDTILVTTEDFSETYVNVDDEAELAYFSGNRILILAEGATNVQVSVNLMLDSFYEEALGVYNRYVTEAEAEYMLLEEDDLEEYVPYSATCNYDYGFNGRILSVVMTYEVVRDDEVITSKTEVTSFDLYTGSYVMLENLVSDMEGFLEAARAQLAFTSGDEEANPEEFTNICIMARNDDTSMYICGTDSNGEMVRALVDISDYSIYLSRYGNIVF